MASTRHPWNFDDLSPDDFERMVYWLVERSGEYDQVQWYGGARDRGRDVVAYRHTAQGREKCYIQCKRYQRIGFATLRDELDKLAAHAEQDPEFAPDSIVFATACPVPPEAKDRAENYARELHLPAPYFWGRLELDAKLKAQPEAEEEFFGLWERGEVLTPVPPPFNLPTDPGCSGRAAEILQIKEQLSRRDVVPVVSIHGMGGVGKTTLGLHVAHELIDPEQAQGPGRFGDAQLTIDLRGTDPDPLDPIDALISLLNLMPGPDPSRPRDLDALAGLWRQATHGKDALLFLDNAHSAEQVRPLLPGSPTCAVLITSDQRFDLGLMPGALRIDLKPMPPDEARDLLQAQAPRLDAGAADRIADLCGHLPLALRTAGSYLGVNNDVPVDEYIAGLEGSRRRMAKRREPGDPYFDVFAIVSLSVDRLEADLRRSWALLSLFPAPFDRDAAASLWGEVLDGIPPELATGLEVLFGASIRSQLVLEPWLQPLDEVETGNRLRELRNRSLLSYDGSARRYFQHDLVRLAATRALEDLEDEDVEAARQRLARRYLGICKTAKALYNQGGEDLLKGLALFDREWPHIQAAQAWAASRAEEDPEAARLCNDYPDAASDLLLLRLRPGEFVTWLEAGLHAARRLGDRLGEANHLGGLGVVYREQKELDRAEEVCRQALHIAREIQDQRNEGRHLNSLGNIYMEREELTQAIGYFQQALTIERERAIEIGDRKGELVPLGSLGVAFRRRGELGRAARYYTEALEIARDTGEWKMEAVTLGNLGNLYEALREPDMAIKLLHEALELERPISDPTNRARWLANLGRIYRDQGNVASARDCWIQALTILDVTGDPMAENIRLLLSVLED